MKRAKRRAWCEAAPSGAVEFARRMAEIERLAALNRAEMERMVEAWRVVNGAIRAWSEAVARELSRSLEEEAGLRWPEGGRWHLPGDRALH